MSKKTREKIEVADYSTDETPVVGSLPVEEPKKAPQKDRSDAEIIAAARKYEKLSHEEHERLRFINQKELWVKQELKYGERVDVHIPLAPGEQMSRKGSKGETAYPMELVQIEGIRTWVPKGRTTSVPKAVADVLSGYIKSLYPVHHEMQNLSNVEFRFDQ